MCPADPPRPVQLKDLFRYWVERYNTKSYTFIMKKLCTKWFKKWAEKALIKRFHLIEAIDNIEKGLSVADLGNNLFKIRVKRSGQGKRSGFRTIVAYRKEDRAIFLYGFGKNEKANIEKAELHYFKKLGNDLLAIDVQQLEGFLEKQILFDLEVLK